MCDIERNGWKTILVDFNFKDLGENNPKLEV